MSFGVAGACDPRLAPGELVLAEAVLAADGSRRPCDAAWRERFLQKFTAQIAIVSAPIFGAHHAIKSPSGKRSLLENYGAATVDMESAGVAASAASAKVPLLALRVVADPADRLIPDSALAGLSPDGRTNPLPVFRSLVRAPRDALALVKLASDFRRARSSLRRVTALGTPSFAFV